MWCNIHCVQILRHLWASLEPFNYVRAKPLAERVRSDREELVNVCIVGYHLLLRFHRTIQYFIFVVR